MPSSMSLLTNVFTGERRGFAIGMWGAATELVSGAGVLVGGVLTGELSWRWIFVVNIVFSILIVVLALRGTPESRDPTAPRRVDIPGALLTATGLTAITLALIQGATWGWGSPAIIALLVGGPGAVRRLRASSSGATANPLVDFDFFKRRNFTGATTTIFVIDFSFGALLFFLPAYFQEILGYSPTETGAPAAAADRADGGRLAARRPDRRAGRAAAADRHRPGRDGDRDLLDLDPRRSRPPTPISGCRPRSWASASASR